MESTHSELRCMLMRGGTSKGAFFLAGDLPRDPAERDALLLRVMGSPDPRQIDGLGGAHPLTSKVAVVAPSAEPGADVDYLFLQVAVEEAAVSDRQNCGNLLAAVGPFAVERGLVTPGAEHTRVRVHMVNSGSLATVAFPTPGGRVDYAGSTAIDGVPGGAAPVRIGFADTEGSACGALLPTGRTTDVIEGTTVTCIDNGMPVVLADARDLGITGYESPAELAADVELLERVQVLRRAAGKAMGLGEVTGTSIPKTTLVAPPRDGGTISTRTFIPVRPHASIGVLGAVTVATALLLDGAVGREMAHLPDDGTPMAIEHPAGRFEVAVDLDTTAVPPRVRGAALVRTARKLFDGTAFPRPR
ncbi:4-oxalomesaconate tautomerase [Actinacidiphila yanglinensis]|uniref:4-oxalomesaconate tautomerase n=1 Tax=Actinacidiphila yanglinensis TaxID=310779 RepID=A0A1H6DPC1_9ACTN|nr:4-oxalomesaconate tautomerase [Actinacidiphila yanglinensis]SEG87162.1 4-oxalomesaconate tautomerase [Actinacidiphila yanglinensis]